MKSLQQDKQRRCRLRQQRQFDWSSSSTTTTTAAAAARSIVQVIVAVSSCIVLVVLLLNACSTTNGNNSNTLRRVPVVLVEAWAPYGVLGIRQQRSSKLTSRQQQHQLHIRNYHHQNARHIFLQMINDSNNDDSNKPPKAGSFFNPVPEPNNASDGDSSNNKLQDDKNNNNENNNTNDTTTTTPKISRAIQPSTINGIPTAQVGFDWQRTAQPQPSVRQMDPITRKPYVGIGPSSLNDVTKPQYDDQGYTLYVDETTGTKSRVFDALLTYPCLFTMKIVGRNDDTFVQDILQIVATTCSSSSSRQTAMEGDSTSTSVDGNTDMDANADEKSTSLSSQRTGTGSSILTEIDHSIKYNGKWASITVQAPVKSSQMLYQLYENIDRDARVKFKF